MDHGDGGESIRKAAAAEYGAWLQEQMARKGWKAATVSRHSGLKKQTIGQILKGEALQPTVWQVASLARTFDVPPGEILAVMGYWEDARAEALPADLLSIYRSLGFPARRALISTGHAIRQMQTEYSAMVRNEDDELRAPEEPEDGEEDQPVPFTPPSGPTRHQPPPAEEVGIPEEDVAASQEPREEDGAGDAGADIAAFSEEELAQEARREAEDYESG